MKEFTRKSQALAEIVEIYEMIKGYDKIRNKAFWEMNLELASKKNNKPLEWYKHLYEFAEKELMILRKNHEIEMWYLTPEGIAYKEKCEKTIANAKAKRDKFYHDAIIKLEKVIGHTYDHDKWELRFKESKISVAQIGKEYDTAIDFKLNNGKLYFESHWCGDFEVYKDTFKIETTIISGKVLEAAPFELIECLLKQSAAIENDYDTVKFDEKYKLNNPQI